MEKALRIVDTINRAVGQYVCFLLPIGVLLPTFYEVLSRRLFGVATQWSMEIALFSNSGILLLGGGFCLLQAAHTRVDVLWGRLPPRGKAIVDLITSPVFWLYMGALFWIGGQRVWLSLMRGECSDTVFAPVMWPIRMCVPLGCLLLGLQGMAKFIRDIRTVVKGA